jgi:hypothetical protein
VPLSREFNEIKDSFLSIMKFVLGKLATTRAITETNPEKLNSMMLLKLKDSLKTCVTAARGLAAPMPCLLMVCIVRRHRCSVMHCACVIPLRSRPPGMTSEGFHLANGIINVLMSLSHALTSLTNMGGLCPHSPSSVFLLPSSAMYTGM